MGMAAGLTIAFSLVFVVLGCYVLFRPGWIQSWLVGTSGLLMIGLAVYAGIYAANIMNYEQLTREHPLATVSFEQKSKQEYIVTVASYGGDKSQYELKGDLWQLDVRLIDWRSGLAGMGFKPGYQLEKIKGRYFSLEDERGKRHSSFNMLKPDLLTDIWKSANSGWSLFLKASRSSASYLPMADGAIFEVKANSGGLVSRPVNQAAEIALIEWE